MAEDVLVFNAKNTLVDSVESFYTSIISGSGTRINAFTASNAVSSSVDYKAYIYDSSGSVQNAVIPQATVVRDKFDLGPSIVGQLIPPGGSLRMESSQVGGILFYVTGDEL
tara:strand:- start:35 stop:367 length:333 start_codon:yes stop_codon:yes gene_type:complete